LLERDDSQTEPYETNQTAQAKQRSCPVFVAASEEVSLSDSNPADLRCQSEGFTTWLVEKGSRPRFRIGYYSWQDGLDCIWLVNEEGKYEQAIDHEFLLKNLEIESIAKERSLYGRGRPQLGPMMRGRYGKQLEEA